MEERQNILAEALRKVLAEDRSILARHEDFLGAVEGKVPVAAIRVFRALENALKAAILARSCSRPTENRRRSSRRRWARMESAYLGRKVP